MKKIFKSKRAWLAAAAVALTLCVCVGSAMAYFTSFDSSAGGLFVRLESSTIVEEGFDTWTKHVSITNTGDTDVYVRVGAFAGSQYTLQFSGDNWAPGSDGFIHYNAVVPAGATVADVLDIIIGGADKDTADQFSVVVVQECTPVTYVDGVAQAPDWSLAVREEG